MNNLTEQLSQYALYHRDRRNIATHLLGVPMIVLAVVILLSRPSLGQVGALAINPAAMVALATVIFYWRLDTAFGAVMSVFLGACLALGAQCAQLSTQVWLGSGLGLFVVGWAIQFIGHYFEGKKPAFVDDVTGLLIGPLFVAAEVAFICGWRKDLQRAIEARAGALR